MRRLCGVPAEDLIAYSDGDLEETRYAEVEEHLKTCWACRDWLRSSEEMGQALRDHFPRPDNPQARIEIMHQVRAIAAARQQQPARRFGHIRSIQHWPAVAAACLALVLVVAIGLPMTTSADFRLAHFINFVANRESAAPAVVAGDREPLGNAVTLENLAGIDHDPVSFEAIEPKRLPFDLELVEATTTGEHLLNLVYTDEQGTIVHLTEQPAEQSTASASTERTRTALIGDTEVLIQYTLADTVSQIAWERQGVVFDLWVAQSVGGGIAEIGMTDVARAIIDAQIQEGTP